MCVLLFGTANTLLWNELITKLLWKGGNSCALKPRIDLRPRSPSFSTSIDDLRKMFIYGFSSDIESGSYQNNKHNGTT